MCFRMRFFYCVVFIVFILNKINGNTSISVVSPLEILVNNTVVFQCTTAKPEGVDFKIGNLGCIVDPVLCTCDSGPVDCLNKTTFHFSRIAKKSWHNETASCRPPFGGTVSVIKLNVTILVTSVTLTPAKITVDAGEQITLTCQTDYCYPTANITWYKASTVLTTPTTDTTDTNSNDLKRTTSVLQYTGVAGDNGLQVYCRATNRPGKNVDSNKYTLDVKYPPSTDPVITASPPGLQYNTGTTVTLTCQLPGGNPVATLSWRCKNTVMTGTNQSNSTTAVSVLSLVMDSSYNNQQCTCTASHSLLTSPKSTSVSLTVFYPPSTDPVIMASPPGLQYNTSTRVTLTCQLPGGYPIATLSWRCKNTVMTGTNLSNSTTAVSVLSLVMDSSYNNQQCTCKATHSLLTSPKSMSVSLTVFYPPSTAPVITASPPGLQYNTGTRVTLTCQLPGGNPVGTLSWRCKNTVMTGTNQSNSTTAVSVLSLVMDSSYNNQQCICKATHSLLTSPKSMSVSLTVFYNNVITSLWNQAYSANEHGPFQLVCEVDGNPSSNITWVYIRNNNILKQDHNVRNSSWYKSSLDCLDYGTYQVIADNGKGPNATKSTNLSVTCKPRLYTTDSQTPEKIGIGYNESLQIFVRILLFPPAIQTTWNFSRTINESKVIENSRDGYRITQVKGDVEQNTTLFKNSVTSEEFGTYTLRVENEIGVFTKIYHVDSTRPPLIPINFTVLCENSLSIKFSWISNFNGGDEQSFQISYSTDSAKSYKDFKSSISDEGSGKSHSYIPTIELKGDLWFTITASNMFGNTTSDGIFCNAVKINPDSSDNLPIIAGAATGSLVFAGLVILGIVFFLRTMNRSGGKKKDPHHSETILTEERESDEDDGLKENKLYISAGPRDDEKPGISGTAVYAEVNKRGPTSDNNANVYAEVQKSGKTAKDKEALYSDTTKQKKGFFKKEEKTKQKKAKKIKQNKEATDVYENPEEIVMTQNMDNVYSNTAESNGTKRDKNGYKNQDGLLYVEVQFDQARQDSGKPVIHGEDEKTDYATVEFPFPPSSNNDKPTDEK